MENIITIGISFMIRAKNEEKTIETAILSLSELKIPYEIIVILNDCTDQTKNIVQKLIKEGNQPISIYEYNYKISRPGLENLVTPISFPQSPIKFYQFCLDKCKREWIFRYDADFQASPKLIDWLNNSTQLFCQKSSLFYKIRLAAKFGNISNNEYYLSNAFVGVSKYTFWEVPIWQQQTINLEHTDLCIYHNSQLSEVKSYWYEKSWFENDLSEEAVKIKGKYKICLELIGGIEPIGMARASNPECDKPFLKILSSKSFLESNDIFLNL